MVSFGSEQIVQIAIDNTAVVAALGNVRIGSTANNKTSTGGTGSTSAVSARAMLEQLILQLTLLPKHQ